MNKLEELIQKRCPNGVEYKKLGDIGLSEKKSTGISKILRELKRNGSLLPDKVYRISMKLSEVDENRIIRIE